MLMLEGFKDTHRQEQAVERVVRFTTSELNCGSPIYAAGARVALRGAKRVEPPVQGRAWQTKPEMPPSQHPARINLQDLKAQIVKKVGPDKASQYFNYFKSFISLKLKKPELDKLVILTIGKENVALHNQLVRAVLNNAIRGEVPPPLPPAQDTSKPVKGIRRKPFSPSIANDDPSSQSPASPATSAWSNGDSFTMSPKKGRSGIRDRKANKERPSPLGPSGRGEPTLSQGGPVDDSTGKSGSIDLFRPLQEIQGAAEQPEADLDSTDTRSGKRPRILLSSEVLPVDSSKGGVKLCSVEIEEEDVEEGQDDYQFRADGSIRAPLGIPFCPGSFGSARKPPFVGLPGPLAQLLLVDGTEEELLDKSDLPDVETMQRQMGQIVAAEGLEGVNRDCADLLNQALDIFLKRLIKACVDIVGSRSAPRQDMQALHKDSGPLWDKEPRRDAHFPALKLHQGVNGVWAGHNLQAPGSGTAGEVTQKEREMTRPAVSLLDFKVAMELNPQQLGEDWPLQLEKISFRSFQ